MPPIAPDCSIDFTRPYSLPFGVPPGALVGADLASYEAQLGVEVEFLELAWASADPFITAEHPRDPFTGNLRVRFLRNAAGVGALTVPTPFNAAGIAPSDMATIAFAALDSAKPDKLWPAGKRKWSPATPVGAETISQAMARTFRWDEHEEKLWAMPQPYFADEALCLYWPPGPAPGGALGADIPGIFAADGSSHLLATTAAARNGELLNDLLRSPVRGLARFTRYRHLGVTEAAGRLSAPVVRTSSAAGAVVLRALPPSVAVPSDPGAPLLRDTFLVFEHVDVQETSLSLAGLWWLQVLRFDELVAIKQLMKDVRSSTAWAIAVYLALATVQPPAVDALGGLPAATRDKLRALTSTPDLPTLRAGITHMLADPGRRTAFADFLRTTLAPLACGVGWADLKDGGGAPRFPGIPAAPAARTATNKAAHALLEAAQQATDIWIAVYAGAPIGRPATRYRTPPAGAPVSDVVRNGFTTFDVEVLVLSGRAATAFPAVVPPPVPASSDQPLPLGAYAGEASGRFATLRIADALPGSIAYTTRDWLRQAVFGWQRTRVAGAPLDFGPMATAGHALASSLAWSRRTTARALRASLDQAHGARNLAGTSLDRAAVTWWSTAVAFSTGADWPVAVPGGVPDVSPAGPTLPSRSGETTHGADVPSGFDEEDLELALEARVHLRSGHDTTQPVDLALVLALLDREGYRMRGPVMRQGPFDTEFRDNLNALDVTHFFPASLGRRGAMQGIGRFFYALQVFGLDVLDWRLLPSIAAVASDRNWLRFAWDNLFTIVTNATMAGTVTGLNTMGLDGRLLLRVISRLDPAPAVGQSRILSRRVHLGGIIAQHGEFQRRHALLRQGSAAGSLDNLWLPSGGTVLRDVPQFTTALAPTPGANAEDPSRADYLAYYALLYLAFNASPAVWQSWVDVATALGAASVPRYLLYDITDADALSDALVPNPVNPATGQRRRELWHRGHFVRFAVALDAYLRMSDTGVGDVAFPVRAGWGV